MSSATTAQPAADLIESAQADPVSYRARVSQLLTQHADDDQACVRVRWAHGLALRECGELPAARDELGRAAAQAEAVGATAIEAMIRSSLAVVLLHLGDTERALQETEVAAAALSDVDAARNAMQRGLILQRLGRQDQAVAAYEQAEPALVAAGDHAAMARLLSNRGVLHAYRGQLDAAQADLERSLELVRELGAPRPVALGLHNLGFVAGRQGRIPDALALLEEADGLLRALDDTAALAVLDTDRAELLADVGLFDEAVERAEAAAAALADDRVNGGEAELLLARLYLLAGRPDRASDLAERLVERFRAAGRSGWELQARYVALSARSGEVAADAAAALADALAAGGWATEARAARLFAARHALGQGRAHEAADLLQELRGASRRAPALARAHHWYATALARLTAGDRTGARRAVGAGLDVLDRSRLVFASAELRAHATAHTTDLVRLGVRLALDDGRPAEALRVLDRVRATDVGVRVRPPDDPQLAADLAELRRLAEVERGAAQTGEDVASVIGARADAERRLRDRARTIAADGGDAAGLRLDIPALRHRLAGRTLAAYLHLDGHLHLVTVTRRATRHHQLGPVSEVATAVAHLRAAVRRLAYGRGSRASLEAAAASQARSADELVSLLALDQLDPDGLVVVPTGVLHGMPWAALAPATGHVPVVTPSAGAWLSAATRRRADGPTLLAAGPDLPGGSAEVAALAERQPGARVLTGRHATVEALLAGMQDAATVHVAAHGSFRADNPMFSSLRLADGPLTVYELEALRRLPYRLVLSSCEAAASTSLRGDAVLGLSSVLLRLGVACLVAPVVEIPDDAAAPLMIEFHTRLADGAAPQRALSEAIAAAPAASPSERAARGAFVLVGAST